MDSACENHDRPSIDNFHYRHGGSDMTGGNKGREAQKVMEGSGWFVGAPRDFSVIGMLGFPAVKAGIYDAKETAKGESWTSALFGQTARKDQNTEKTEKFEITPRELCWLAHNCG